MYIAAYVHIVRTWDSRFPMVVSSSHTLISCRLSQSMLKPKEKCIYACVNVCINLTIYVFHTLTRRKMLKPQEKCIYACINVCINLTKCMYACI